MKKILQGAIELKDSNKLEYNVKDILELVELNFGYVPLKSSHDPRHTSNEYRTVTQTIRRKLENKKLPNSTSHNTLYPKDAVYKLLSYDLFDYFLEKAKLSNEYEEHIRQAAENARQNMTSADNPLFQSEKEKLKWNIKLKILMDYFEKNFIHINEELIDSDINAYFDSEDIAGRSLDELADSDYLILNRLTGNVEEYYRPYLSKNEKEQKYNK